MKSQLEQISPNIWNVTSPDKGTILGSIVATEDKRFIADSHMAGVERRFGGLLEAQDFIELKSCYWRRLTAAQKRLIREHGRRLARAKSFTLELGEWFSTIEGEDRKSFNLDRFPETPEGHETSDLAETIYWSEVVKEYFPDDCLLDFYVYSRGGDGELRDNLIVRIRDRKIVELYATGTRESDRIWTGAV